MTPSTAMLMVEDASGIEQARRVGAQMASSLAFDGGDVARVVLIITELATNVFKHAHAGLLLLQLAPSAAPSPLQVLALDTGRGMANVGAWTQDGSSASGRSGTGLGAVFRLADHVEVYSQPSRGTAVLAEIARSRRPPDDRAPIQHGAVLVPKPSEPVSGDGWRSGQQGERWRLFVSDGLGHGQSAADASQEAGALFARHLTAAPADLLKAVHAGLRGTRGAAAAVTDLDVGRGLVTFSGVGNIAGCIVQDGTSRHLISQPGILGREARRYQEFTYPWPSAALLIVHSDGLSSHWSLGTYPGLEQRHPALIAGVLFRDHRRSYDDVAIVVARERRG